MRRPLAALVVLLPPQRSRFSLERSASRRSLVASRVRSRSAAQEQLGLKLESSTGPVDMLVIEPRQCACRTGAGESRV
jgi:uncharacterized protein (TIGR03435 family)